MKFNNPSLKVLNLVLWLLHVGVQGKPQPHIIFILSDDMGWNDVGFHGMTDIPTPNLDAMAADSVHLNNHYSCPMCTPSRSSLLSGKYPSSIGMQHFVLLNGRPWGLPLDLKILPEHLNDLGYESHMVGKWHLGTFKRQHTPTYRGFQTHFGFWNGALDFFELTSKVFHRMFYDMNATSITGKEVLMNGKDFRDQMKPFENEKKEYLTTLLTRRARQVIRKHDQTKPLFLYLAHHGVHRGNIVRPIQGPEKEKKNFAHFKDPNKIAFAAALTSLDYSVGVVFDALEKKGMLLNSVVVFVSDNGAPIKDRTSNWGSNWPLRGEKTTPFEGGVKTVAMVWSPLLKKAPKLHDGLYHLTDWLPTLYKLGGGNLTRLGAMDGVDQWESLRTGRNSNREEVLVMLDTVTNVSAIRNDRYKLVQRSKDIAQEDFMYDMDDRRSEPGYKVSWKESKVYEVLKRFYGMRGMGTKFLKKPIITVECGEIDEEEEEKGKQDGLALFDLKEDPCERRNVAKVNPEVVDALYQRLQFWLSKSVPTGNVPLDLTSDPKYFNGFWDTWKDYAHLNLTEQLHDV